MTNYSMEDATIAALKAVAATWSAEASGPIVYETAQRLRMIDNPTVRALQNKGITDLDKEAEKLDDALRTWLLDDDNWQIKKRLLRWAAAYDHALKSNR